MSQTPHTFVPLTIKFAHVQTEVKRQTIGYRINDENRTVEYAIAKCNHKDTFNKKLGRDIVTGRILKGGTHSDGSARVHVVPLDTVGSTRYRDITAFIMAHA